MVCDCECRKPRGFGFVQYIDPADAADAKYELDGQVLLGRELTVVFAEENRKRPEQMRARDSSRLPSLDFSELSRNAFKIFPITNSVVHI